MSKSLPDNPRAALQAFILHVETAYLTWYERSVSLNYGLWFALQLVSLLAGFGSALVAALLDADQLRGFQAGRLVLIVLPILGSLVSTVLVQSRVNARWALRDEGRLEFQTLLNDARTRFTVAKTDAEWSAVHDDLNKKAKEIERKQSERFFADPPNFT